MAEVNRSRRRFLTAAAAAGAAAAALPSAGGAQPVLGAQPALPARAAPTEARKIQKAAASKLRLTFAAGDYEIVRALKEGAVEAEGIELIMLTDLGSAERHWRMARHAEFEMCELNIGAYMMGRDRGEPWTAIPVFLHRRFRHGFLFVNPKAGIREPKDLIGKVVGGTNFQPAGNLWMRGIMEEHFGVPHKSITWLVEREEDVKFEPPPGLRIEMVKPGKRLDVMLAENEIPAMLSPELPTLFLKGDKRIVRLFPNYKDLEVAYFKKTGIFPIMHATAIKQEIVDKYPWVPINLMKAFQKAKQIAYRRVANPRVVPLAWVRTFVEEQEEVLGRDPWQYGLTPANRKNLETIQRYVHQQGLISRKRPLEELFADVSLGDSAGGGSSGGI